ncbi:hypothetical protein JHK82_012188 [Glycine max]|uniref:ATP-dependent DNA helicase n=1 Tax=Glycine max TaxID=3847 RepID=K7KNY2_SOYBN|nr:hypothetical protein JHK85_012524 [Glycine max]KAG5057194.1 hypothetical protein JHK86_012190 [Glycine max]KAG5154219.1 hypothetical protein JHK82_012188 [Glycine max]
MLDENNAHAKSFRMARDRLTDTQVHNVRLKLIDGRTYNIPSVPEVAALIAGDIDANSNIDIIVETQNGQLQRIHELHCSYLALQYPLLFPYGEDEYRTDILHRDTLSGKKRKRNRLTMRKWFAYRLQCRPNEGQTLLHSRKLFQQFVAEGYTMIESERLSYVRCLCQGKRIILPSTFVGSPRYMDQLYFDGISICSHVGFPNLFITFTCNPNWLEIHRLLTPLNLTAIDRPKIISRIFKLKYEQMLSHLTKNHLLGKVVAWLPHVHLLLFLHTNNKYPSLNDIDHIISVEIPSQKDDPELYNLVQNHMIHGPCGILRPASPCMKEGKCNGYGYPVYCRRDTGQTITKNGIIIDNRCIVPYNPKLLKKYQAHINIEWCNQSTSIKYLFKYINKGYDRVTVVMVHDDNETVPHANTPNGEIKEYLDCRYISPCESTWRIFGFPIHGRKPSVERLQFHLPSQHSVFYQDHDDIDDLLSNPSISESKFITWMNTKDWGSAPYLRNLFVLLLLTDQQTKIYNQIIQAVNKNEGEMFFLYGYGGTRKTFIWKTLAASLRVDNKIVIMVASSGIASFLIIWDEAPMAHKFCFEALDRSLRDAIKVKSSSDKIFGGKVMLFGGDFRQILPVIPRGSRSDIVNSNINSTCLWNHCHVLALSKNMRLEANTDAIDKEETAAFAKWILNIGDGIAGQQNDGYGSIEIPKDLIITEYDDPLYAIVNSIFPNLSHHHTNPEYFQIRAILASTNETIQEVNDYILSLIPGDQMEYLSVDYVDKSETLESSHFRSLTTEFLNSLTTSNLIITSKSKLDHLSSKHVIAADIISGKNIDQNVYIPRMSMSPSQSPWPFKLLRRHPKVNHYPQWAFIYLNLSSHMDNYMWHCQGLNK